MVDCKSTKVKNGFKEPMNGDLVIGDIQVKLGRNIGKLNKIYYFGKIDNDFGPMTDTAVRNYQKDNGLVVDGIVGQITLKSLGLCDEAVIVPEPPTENLNTKSQDITKNELKALVFAQPDDYTCGPTSVMISLSVYDFIDKNNFNSSLTKFRQLSRTNTDGTIPENLDSAVNKFNSNFTMSMEKYLNLGTIKKWIDKGVPIVCHIGTIPELGYNKYYGHFIAVLGYDYKINAVKIIDPGRTKYGVRWINLNILKKAIDRRAYVTPIHSLKKRT